jgi:hypothetical protein
MSRDRPNGPRQVASDIQDTPERAFFSRDLTRSCKTGEVVEPIGMRQKIRTLIVGLALGGIVVVAMELEFSPWLRRYTDAQQLLASKDAVAGALHAAEFGSLMLLIPVLLGVGVATWTLLLSVRVLRAGRWPLPGAKVARKTEVIAGWCLYLRFGLLVLLWPGFIVMIWYNYVQLTTVFWNGYFEKQAATMLHATRYKLMHKKSNGQIVSIAVKETK